MSRKQKVLEISGSFNCLVCIRDNTKQYNPYYLYLVYPDKDRYGYPTRHKKQLAVYGDMTSVICHIRDMYVYGGFLFKGTSDIITWNKDYYKGGK